MAFCPLCERKFEDRRGLHGHFRFVHGIEYGSGKPAKRTALTEAIGRNIRRRVEGSKLMKEIEEESGGSEDEENERREKREDEYFIFRNV